MNFKAMLLAAAEIYDELATGGAKAQADKFLGALVVLIGSAPPASPPTTPAA
jgi:hypothetical protein